MSKILIDEGILKWVIESLEKFGRGESSGIPVTLLVHGLREALAEQPFFTHCVDQPYDWSEWVCPDPKSYLFKCCDCGLVHEAEFGVVRYKSDTEREDCDMVEDPNLQAVFRMRRSEQWSPADTAHRAGGLHMEQPAQQEPVACVIGAKGSAFDSPKTKRAYTYAEQPGNVVASKLGRSCDAAMQQRAGDSIDRGLALLQELQKEGFGVFDLGAEYATSEEAACKAATAQGNRLGVKSTDALLNATPQAQPAREFVGLTDEEENEYNYLGPDMHWVIQEIAAKLKEKNT